jgi:hypothetical protein
MDDVVVESRAPFLDLRLVRAKLWEPAGQKDGWEGGSGGKKRENNETKKRGAGFSSSWVHE